MAPQILTSRLSPEGRAVIPAAVRQTLGAAAGSRILFILEEDGVRVVSAEQMQRLVWANNLGGDARDSVKEVRSLREADQARDDGLADLLGEEDDDPRTADEVTAALFASIGLPLPGEAEQAGQSRK